MGLSTSERSCLRRMNFLMMTYLTHLLVDFIFQSDATVRTKSGKISWVKLKCLVRHAIISNLVVGIIVYLLVGVGEYLIHNSTEYALNWKNYVLILLWVSGFHFVLDSIKNWLDSVLQKRWFKKQHEVVTYTLDQLLHLFSIYLSIRIVLGVQGWSDTYTQLVKLLAKPDVIAIMQCVLVLLILETKFSEYFVGKFLTGTGVIPSANENKDGSKIETTQDTKYHLGGYIGNLERIMIAIFFFANSIPSISIVVAIKAVTRFKALEEQSDFAEYYLIGSILSLLLGCLFPLLAKLLFL